VSITLIDRAKTNEDRTAIKAIEGVFSYHDLLESSLRVAAFLLDGREDLAESPVAYLVPPGFSYVAVQWGIWRAGGIAVPLSLYHPGPELDYVLKDTAATTVIAHPDYNTVLQPLAEKRGIRFASTDDVLCGEAKSLPDVDPQRRAMIVYTSGTTGRPKGVVTTHRNIEAQVTSLVEAWGWRSDDRILEFLPLHHVHGIVAVLTCALWRGALCEIMPRFDAEEVLRRVLEGGLTLFMAVPTIYVKLIQAWESRSIDGRSAVSEAFSAMRLMVSGSAALPVSVLERWREISGHVLLERYGMTEIGMALSNPLHGARGPGCVGNPLPGVQVKLVNEEGHPVAPGTAGEIHVKGPGVFLEYWNRPDETSEAFSAGWFRTGDIAVMEAGNYRILGRSSVDIIKTGGYKVSALEIEEVLLNHPDVAECAVIGIEDTMWGERICAAVVPVEKAHPHAADLTVWVRERLATYKSPREFMIVEELPRNPMGKVSKPTVAKLFQD
jgi:malonyl-CoA/methylmalonyl-CoA synthetase